ncbi:MAG: polyprenyl synthetase family protein [Clostridia bacterium]|nr:polyprenyl synthetase family protein [Clostridia bacterium]
MKNAEYKSIYSKYLDLFNEYSEKVFSSVKSDNNLAEAMKYSFFAGGKRIRPVLTLAFADSLKGNLNEVLPFALALECIHTYSLIHDDLPALDNDVLRRGKPTCHVKFNESTAILAGDALLNFAFEHALENCTKAEHIEALKTLARLSGYMGMLSGQQTDIENENATISEQTLLKIHELKTCKLLTAPFLIGSILFDKDKEDLSNEFGYISGLLFQFTDDVLDVLSSEEKLGKSIGKDLKSNKLTSVKAYGLNGTLEIIKSYGEQAENIAKSLDSTGFLQCFINEITERINEN